MQCTGSLGQTQWIIDSTVINRDIFGDGDFGDYGIALNDEKITFNAGKGNANMESFSSLTTIIAFLLLVIVVLFITSGVRIVPEHRRLMVFRLGRPVGAKGPGLVFVIPVIDRALTIDLRQQEKRLQREPVDTQDNVHILVDLTWRYKIIDPEKSVLTASNVERVLAQFAGTALKSVIASWTYGDILNRRQQIEEETFNRLRNAGNNMGVEITSLELQIQAQA